MEYLETLDRVTGILSMISVILHFTVCYFGYSLHRTIHGNKISPLWASSFVIFLIQPFIFCKTMRTTKTIFAKKKLSPIVDFGGCYLTFLIASIAIAAFILIRFTMLTTYAESEMAILAYGLTASGVLSALSLIIGAVVLYDSRKQIRHYLAARKKKQASQSAHRG